FVSPTPARLEELALAAATAATAVTGRLRDKLSRFALAASEADPVATANEHVFLFARQVRCSPYESAYSGLSPFGDKTARLADVAGFYEAFGVRPAPAQPDMEDHIGAELEFMSALALKEAYARSEGESEAAEITRGAEVAFLTDHLGRWAEAFAGEVEEATPLPFYTAAASLLAAWITAEVEALGATPSRVGAPDALDAEAAEPFSCPMASEAPPA
ncbi:MAG: molecular chaperone TorD family protein, partial [candidate division NC10 bacterium]